MKKLLSVVLLSACTTAVQADEVKVAVAANFKGTMERIGKAFTAKTGHDVVISSAATGVLFVVRGGLMLAKPGALRARWARILPHVIDTVLLAAALGMLWLARLNPADAPWLLAKIAALVLYVGLGTVALKRGRTRSTRVVFWILAMVVFAYIVAVALTKDPWPL